MSDPGFIFGQVPTAAQWNSAFGTKQDTLGFTPVNRAGDNMGGKLVTTASIAATAGLSVPPGVAPSAPINGDIWLTNLGVFAQVNGSSVQFATGGAVNSGTANQLAYYAASGSAISGNPNLTVFNGALTLGVPGSIAGTLILSGLVSGGVTLASATAGGSGTITLPSGTVNFSATGGANQVVRQNSAGGIFTVGQLSVSNLSNSTLGSGSIVLANSSTGTGAIVFANSPILISPTLTTPVLSGTLTATALQFSPTTSGIVGTPTNDSASAGIVGELISASVGSGAAVALSTGTVGNVTSISLTAGDWDVTGIAVFNGSVASTATYYEGSISTISATLNTTVGNFAVGPAFGSTPFQFTPTLNIGPVRLSLSTTTVVFLVAVVSFSSGTANAYGIIRARRIR